MSYEDEPGSVSPIDRYLQIAKDVLLLDGYEVAGELSIGGTSF